MRSMLTVLVSRSQFDRCEEQLFVCRPRQCRACRPQSRGRVRSKVCNKPPRRLAADEVSSLLRHCSREQRAPLNVCVWGSAEDGFSQPSCISARLHVAAPANSCPRRAATSGLGCSPPCEAAVSSESGSVSLPGQRLAVSAPETVSSPVCSREALLLGLSPAEEWLLRLGRMWPLSVSPSLRFVSAVPTLRGHDLSPYSRARPAGSLPRNKTDAGDAARSVRSVSRAQVWVGHLRVPRVGRLGWP